MDAPNDVFLRVHGLLGVQVVRLSLEIQSKWLSLCYWLWAVLIVLEILYITQFCYEYRSFDILNLSTLLGEQVDVESDPTDAVFQIELFDVTPCTYSVPHHHQTPC